MVQDRSRGLADSVSRCSNLVCAACFGRGIENSGPMHICGHCSKASLIQHSSDAAAAWIRTSRGLASRRRAGR